MNRCVIIGQAAVNDYKRIKEYFRQDDYFVYCDGGLKHMTQLCVKPDLIVGDFDSSDNPDLDVETIILPCEKDDTDTCHAMNLCIQRGFRDFLFIGCLGERLDHTMGNISFLIALKEKGLYGKMVDDYSEIEIVTDKGVTVNDDFSFFSLLALSDSVEGITIKGAKYPLENATVKSSFQYGISNEVLKGETAEITAVSGNLLVIKVF